MAPEEAAPPTPPAELPAPVLQDAPPSEDVDNVRADEEEDYYDPPEDPSEKPDPEGAWLHATAEIVVAGEHWVNMPDMHINLPGLHDPSDKQATADMLDIMWTSMSDRVRAKIRAYANPTPAEPMATPLLLDSPLQPT